jgi:predicted phosphodiesterase
MKEGFRCLFLILLLFIPIFAYVGITYAQNLNFDSQKDPYVYWTGIDPSSSVYIGWESLETESSHVWIGTNPTSLTLNYSNSNPVSLHIATLTHLSPNQIYYYRVGPSISSWSSIGQFRTASISANDNSSNSFNCTFISDTHEGLGFGHYDKIAEVFASDSFATDFLVDVGDICDDEEGQPRWNQYFKLTNLYSHKFPFIPVLGNNDDQSDSQFYEYFASDALKIASINSPHYYYAFNNSQTQFINLDYHENINQTAWINATLTAGQNQAFRILSVHKMTNWVYDLIAYWNITAVFCGHYHHYERYSHDGVPIFQLGGGGALMSISYSPRPNSAAVSLQPCYTQLFFDDSTLQIETRALDNTMVDSIKLGGTF